MLAYFQSFFNHGVIIYVMLTFVILALYSYFISKYRDNFSYAAENTLFANFPNNNFMPKSKLDYLAVFFFILYLCVLAWNSFYQVHVRHLDSIGMISHASCYADHFIGVWAPVNGRFMPLAHQEFNWLSPIFRYFDCSYAFLYSLTFIQLLIAMYLINKILPLKTLYQRLFAIFFITSNIAFINSFSNIIINDRNTIFLAILFIYYVIGFYKKGENKYLIYALICANISIYFKEPMFLFYGGFAATSLLFKMIEAKISPVSIIKKPLRFITTYPLEIGLLLCSSLFVFAYVLWTFILFPPEVFYGVSGKKLSYGQFFTISFWGYSLYLITPILAFLFIKDFKTIKYRNFITCLFVGGIAYSLVMIVAMRTTNFHYYTVATLAIFIAGCYYLASKKMSWAFKAMLAVVILYSLNLSYQNVVPLMHEQKARQIWTSALDKNIKFQENKSYNVFYYGKYAQYGDYRASTIYALLKTIVRDKSAIKLYTFYDCYIWDKGKDGDANRCLKADSFEAKKYDIIILQRGDIPDEEWQDLANQYGNRMEKITHYPKFLNIAERKNIYVIYN